MRTLVLVTLPDGMRVEVDHPGEDVVAWYETGVWPFSRMYVGWDEHGTRVTVNPSSVSRMWVRDEHLHPRETFTKSVQTPSEPKAD